MTFLKTVVPTLAIALAGLSATPAMATDYPFNLSGTPSGTASIDFLVSPFEIVAGDVIKVDVNLTSPFTVPANPGDYVLFFEALLSVSLDDPPGGTTTETYFKMLDGGLAGLEEYAGCTNCVFSSFGQSPGSTPFSFSSFYTELTIIDLLPQGGGSDPVSVSGFRLSLAYFNAPPVPEPETWAMMIGGFAMVGGAMRRRVTRPTLQRA